MYKGKTPETVSPITPKIAMPDDFYQKNSITKDVSEEKAYDRKKPYKHKNYVSIFRDDFNQKVIATPINKPIRTEQTFLREHKKSFIAENSKNNSKRTTNNISISDSEKIVTPKRYNIYCLLIHEFRYQFNHRSKCAI